MGLPNTEITFIKQIFQPVVNMHVEGYMLDGHTLESAWSEFFKQKPEGTSETTIEIMQSMFNESWAKLSEKE